MRLKIYMEEVAGVTTCDACGAPRTWDMVAVLESGRPVQIQVKGLCFKCAVADVESNTR
jgi:hypothetical protein